jgi:hypothetical protein
MNRKRKLNRVLVLYASCYLDYNILNQLQFQVKIAICAANPKLVTFCSRLQLLARVAQIAVIAAAATGCNQL